MNKPPDNEFSSPSHSGIEERVNDLVDRYELALDAGEALCVEELCGKEIELLPLLKKKLRGLEQFDQLRKNNFDRFELPQQLKHYQIVRLIDRGGLGNVYLAQHVTLKREVAIKVIRLLDFDASARNHFRRQISVVRQFRHRAVCDIFDCDTYEVDGVIYGWLAMHFLSGGRLDEFVRREQPSLRAIVQYFVDIVDGVAKAAGSEILHCDLKPANLLMSEDGRPYVTDFGLARLGDERQLSNAIRSRGTRRYLAPELIQQPQSLPTVVSEIYSLGITFTEVLRARFPTPVSGVTVGDQTNTQGTCEPEDIRHCPALQKLSDKSVVAEDLKCVIDQMSAPTSSERYQDYLSLQRDLKRLLDKRPVSARPLSTAVKLGRWATRNPTVAGLLGFLLLLLLVMVLQITVSISSVRMLNAELSIANSELSQASEHLRRSAVSSRLNALQSVAKSNPLVAHRRLHDHQMFPVRYRRFAWHLLRHQTEISSTDLSKSVGQLQEIRRVQISPDGLVCAVLSEPNQLSLIDLKSRKRIDVPVSVQVSGNGVAFTENGSDLFVNQGGNRLLRVDSRTGTIASEFSLPESVQSRLAVSEDGEFLVGITMEGSPYRFMLNSEEFDTIPFAFSKRAAGLWLSNRNGTLNIVDRAGLWVKFDPQNLSVSNKPVNLMALAERSLRRDFDDLLLRGVSAVESESGLSNCLALTFRDGQCCLIFPNNKYLCQWTRSSGLASHTALSDELAICPDRLGGKVRHLQTGKERALLDSRRQVSAVDICNRTQQVVIGGLDGRLTLIERPDFERGMTILRPFESWPNLGFGTPIHAQSVGTTKEKLIVHREGWTAIMRQGDSTPVSTFKLGKSQVGDVVYGPKKKLLAYGFRRPDACVRVIRLSDVDRKIRKEADLPILETPKSLWEVRLSSNVVDMCFLKDESSLFVAERSGRIVAYKPEEGRELWSIQLDPTERATCLTLLEDRLFVGGRDGMISELSAKTGRRLNTFRNGDSEVTAICSDALRQIVVVASRSGVIRTRNSDGSLLNEILAHQRAVLSLASAADGTVASGGADEKVIVFDIRTGEIQLELIEHKGPVVHVNFSADGRALTSSSTDLSSIQRSLNSNP